MGAENLFTPAAAGKRMARRSRVLLAAKLQTPFGEADCRLRDLSRKGALVECGTLPPVGAEVVFSRGTVTVPARVAWAGSGRIGLEFHYAIDENEVLVQLRKTTNGPQQPRFRRPGLNEGLTDDARKLAREWGVTVGIALPDSL